MNHSDDEIFGRNIDQLDRETPRYNLSEDEKDINVAEKVEKSEEEEHIVNNNNNNNNIVTKDVKPSENIIKKKMLQPSTHKPQPSVASVQPYGRSMNTPTQTTAVLSPSTLKKQFKSVNKEKNIEGTSQVPSHQTYNKSMYPNTQRGGYLPTSNNAQRYQTPPSQLQQHVNPPHDVPTTITQILNNGVHTDQQSLMRPHLSNQTNTYIQGHPRLHGNPHLQRGPAPSRIQANPCSQGVQSQIPGSINVSGNTHLPGNPHSMVNADLPGIPHILGNPQHVPGNVSYNDRIHPMKPPPTAAIPVNPISPMVAQQMVIKPERQRIEDEILLRQRELDSCWQEDEVDCPRDFTAIDRNKERCYAEWTSDVVKPAWQQAEEDHSKASDPLKNRETKTAAASTSAIPTSIQRDHTGAPHTGVPPTSNYGPIMKAKAKAVVSPLPRPISQKKVNINTVVSQFSYTEEPEMPQDYSNPSWPMTEMGSRIPSSERINFSPLCMSGVPSGVQTPAEPGTGQTPLDHHLLPQSTTTTRPPPRSLPSMHNEPQQQPSRSLPSIHNEMESKNLNVIDKFKGNEQYQTQLDIPIPPAADSIKNYTQRWPQSEMGSRIPSSERISLSPLTMSGIPSGIQTPAELHADTISQADSMISKTSYSNHSIRSDNQSSTSDFSNRNVREHQSSDVLKETKNNVELPPDTIVDDNLQDYSQFPQSELTSRVPSIERICLSPLCQSGIPSGCQTPADEEEPIINENGVKLRPKKKQPPPSADEEKLDELMDRMNLGNGAAGVPRFDYVEDDQIKVYGLTEQTSRIQSYENLHFAPWSNNTSGIVTPCDHSSLYGGVKPLRHQNNGGIGDVEPGNEVYNNAVNPQRQVPNSKHCNVQHVTTVDHSIDGVSPVDERDQSIRANNITHLPLNECEDSWSSAGSTCSNRTDMSTVVNAPTSMHNTAPASPDQDGSEVSDSDISEPENIDTNSELPASYSQPLSPSLSVENLANRQPVNHRPPILRNSVNRHNYEQQHRHVNLPNPSDSPATSDLKNLIQMAKEQFPKQHIQSNGGVHLNNQPAGGVHHDIRQTSGVQRDNPSSSNHVKPYVNAKQPPPHHEFMDKHRPQHHERHHVPPNEHRHPPPLHDHRAPPHGVIRDHHGFNPQYNDDHYDDVHYDDDYHHEKGGYQPRYPPVHHHSNFPPHPVKQNPVQMAEFYQQQHQSGFNNMIPENDFHKPRMQPIPEGKPQSSFQRGHHGPYPPVNHNEPHHYNGPPGHMQQRQHRPIPPHLNDSGDQHFTPNNPPPRHPHHIPQEYIPHVYHNGQPNDQYATHQPSQQAGHQPSHQPAQPSHQTAHQPARQPNHHVPHQSAIQHSTQPNHHPPRQPGTQPSHPIGYPHQQIAPQTQSRTYSITSLEPNRDSPPHSESLDTESVVSFASMAASNQNLDTKADMMSSLLSMLGTHDPDDMARTLLAMSSSPDSCAAMRQSGCLPLIIQLLHNNQEEEVNWGARQRAGLALHNIVHSNSIDRRGKREIRVLRLLEIIRTHSEAILSQNDERYRTNRVAPPLREHGPGPAVAAIMKLSFEEEHKNTICELGGLQTIGEILAVDYMENSTCHDPYSMALRKYAGMVLINLTYNDSKNKAVLCSMPNTLKAITGQLRVADAEDLVQVYAGIIRNISWRPDDKTQKALQNVNAIRALLLSIQNLRTEICIRTVLSAVWNLSAHNSQNKEEVCRTPGSLKYLAYALKYRSPSNSFDVVENAGGILRNVSSHIALNMQYRRILRQEGCLQTLVAQLRSPSTHVISNSCGVLWNLSARCVDDQQLLWDLGAVSILKTLIHVKHKSISAGAAAALRNLLAVTPGSGTDTESNMSFHQRSNSLPMRDQNKRNEKQHRSMGPAERKRSKVKNDNEAHESKLINYTSTEEGLPPTYHEVFGPSLHEMRHRQPSASSQMFFPAEVHDVGLPANRIHNRFQSTSSCSSFSPQVETNPRNNLRSRPADGFSPISMKDKGEEKVMMHNIRSSPQVANRFHNINLEESSFIETSSLNDTGVTENDVTDLSITSNPYEDANLSRVKDFVLIYAGRTPKVKKKSNKKEKKQKITTPKLLSKTQRAKKSLESILSSKDSLLSTDIEKVSRDQDKKDGNIWIKTKGLKKRILNKSHSSDLAFDKNVKTQATDKKSTFELYSMATFPDRVASDQCLSMTDRFIRDNLHGEKQLDMHHGSWSSFDVNHCNEERIMPNQQGGIFTPNLPPKRMNNPYSYPADDNSIRENPYNFPPNVFNQQQQQQLNLKVHSNPYLHSISNPENNTLSNPEINDNEIKKGGKFKRISKLKNPLKKSSEQRTKKLSVDKPKVKEKR